MKTRPLYFMGKGPDSKSLYLRALLVQSYFPAFQIKQNATDYAICDDVHYMQKALKQLKAKIKTTTEDRQNKAQVIDCGLSGAVLRFLALRVARESILRVNPTGFMLKGQARLFERPMRELFSILGQLSCEVNFLKNTCGIYIKSMGWRPKGDAITLPIHRSSQFASTVLLNSWLLPFDLYLSIEGNLVSASYLQMTLSFLRSLGMQITSFSSENHGSATKNTSNNPASASINKEYFIPAKQKPNTLFYELEQDMGALFALSAMSISGGSVLFKNWPDQSLQPDFVFPSLLQKMGFNVEYVSQHLKVSPGPAIHPITYNIRDCPDLFPILSALCALSTGESRLYGAPHLCHKESHRVQKTAELLTKAGKTVCVLEDGLVISGPIPNKAKFDFDPAQDHRMAMAGGVLKKAGFPIRILNPEVVNKSFPDFWTLSHLNPLE